MKEPKRSFIECFLEFIADPEGLTDEEIVADLESHGIDTQALIKRVEAIKKKYLNKRKISQGKRK